MSQLRNLHSRGRTAVSALAGLLLLSSFAAAPAGASPADPAPDSGTYIVRYHSNVNPRAAAASAKARGVAVQRVVTNVFPGMIARLTPAQRDAVAKDPAVAAIEADQVVTLAATTQDDAPWGLDRIDQARLPLSGTYTYGSDGTGVEAYIIDTGVYAVHDEFGGRVTGGFDAVDGDGDPADCQGHGTHVAGTVAGTTYGVAKGATIVPVRVLDCGGSGTTSGIIAGLDWVATDHAAGEPAVANMSLRGIASAAMDLAVKAVIADGVTMVVAAGNEMDFACSYSPSRVTAALTIAASTIQDRPAFFTNHGACVDLFAPGLDITSAWIGAPDATATISGTSMASPHVAGAAALVLEKNPSWTPAQVSASITRNATKNALTGVKRGTPNLLLRITS